MKTEIKTISNLNNLNNRKLVPSHGPRTFSQNRYGEAISI